jgi:hypothetical protein
MKITTKTMLGTTKTTTMTTRAMGVEAEVDLLKAAVEKVGGEVMGKVDKVMETMVKFKVIVVGGMGRMRGMRAEVVPERAAWEVPVTGIAWRGVSPNQTRMKCLDACDKMVSIEVC